MNYLLGKQTFLKELSKSYNEKIKNDSSFVFKKYNFNSLLFLNENQCKDLYEKTYLNDDLPFGKVDHTCLVGKIETVEAQINQFNQKIKSALEKIYNIPELKSNFESIAKCFVPLRKSGEITLRENGNGSSTHWFKGAIFLSLPVESKHAELELILNMVHELGHQSLMIYQDCDKLILNGLQTSVYSSIRKKNRPAIMSFHALIAIHYMLTLFKNKNSNQFWLQLSEFEKSYLTTRENELRVAFISGAEALKSIEWTALGKNIYLETINEYLTQYSNFEKINDVSKKLA